MKFLKISLIYVPIGLLALTLLAHCNLYAEEIHDFRVRDLEKKYFHILEGVAKTEKNWIGVHAMESMLSLGHLADIEEIYSDSPDHYGSLDHRVGVWRVLAQSSGTFEERAVWIGKLEETFLDDSSVDRLQALESLCKLGNVPSIKITERALKESLEGQALGVIYSLWALSLANQSNALQKLTELLKSHDVEMRRKTAYILSRLKPKDPRALGALVSAFDREPSGTEAKLYMACAILKLNVAPNRVEYLCEYLESKLLSLESKQQLEVFQALANFWSINDIQRIESMIDSLQGDGKIGGAFAALYLLMRHEGLHGAK